MDERAARQIQLLHTLPKHRGVVGGRRGVQLDFKWNFLGSEIDNKVDFMSLRGAHVRSLMHYRS